MYTPIKKVVSITPVWNEPLAMIQAFENKMQVVRAKLNDRGIGFQHYFLDDAAVNLPEGSPILVRHEANEGLARTLLDGYSAALRLRATDIIVRLDCQEHDPEKIIETVDHMSTSPIGALFLPVYYWVEGEDRPMMREVIDQIANFLRALSPIQKDVVLSTYNQVFPLGYQAFRRQTLQLLMEDLVEGIKTCEMITREKASWGLDLLAILLAAKRESANMDFIWGGWSTPWRENRGADKIESQRKRAETMVQVAERLGAQIAK